MGFKSRQLQTRPGSLLTRPAAATSRQYPARPDGTDETRVSVLPTARTKPECLFCGRKDETRVSVLPTARTKPECLFWKMREPPAEPSSVGSGGQVGFPRNTAPVSALVT